VAVSAVESVRSNLERSVGAFHASPPSGDRWVRQRSVHPLATSAGLLVRVQRAARRTTSSDAELRGGAALQRGSILKGPSQALYSDRALAATSARWRRGLETYGGRSAWLPARNACKAASVSSARVRPRSWLAVSLTGLSVTCISGPRRAPGQRQRRLRRRRRSNAPGRLPAATTCGRWLPEPPPPRPLRIIHHSMIAPTSCPTKSATARSYA
jgi:hypothetical protein